MKRSNRLFARTFSALALACAAGSAWAQTATSATSPAAGTDSASPAPATANTPTGKLASTFTALAGSRENAASLVNGLRRGTTITLTDTSGGQSLSFTPPTRPMGYGNVRIALSLAEAQLASQGVGNPTPAQLQGALMGTTTTGPGGTSTTTRGILQMRASGMGWGQIANSMGFKLGAVMSGKQVVTAAGTSATGTSAGRDASSVTTAAGTTAAGHGKSGITTAGGSVNAGSQGKSRIVTAGGGGSGQVSTGLGHGGGAGASAGVAGAAGGNAGAHGKGGKP